MKVVFHRAFKKQWRYIKQTQQEKFLERLELYLDNPSTPLLRDHSLSGQWKGYRSINVGGDLRAIYKLEKERSVKFVAIGTHSQLYQ